MRDREPLALARWLTDKYILALLTLLPAFPGFHGYRQISAAKFWLYAVLTALWLLGLGCCALRGLRPRLRDWGAFPWLLTAFLLWNILSALLSPRQALTLMGAGRYDGLLSQLLYGLTALGVCRLGRWERRYVYALGISVTFCCAVAVLQLAGGDPLGLYPNGWRFADAGTLYSGLYLGTVGNTLILGSVLSLALPLFLYTALRERGASLWLLLPALLGGYVLWRSDCSSAAVGLLVATLLIPPRLCPARARKWVWLGEGVLLLLGLGLVYFRPGESGVLWELSRLLHGEVQDSFGSSRIRIWRETWALVGERPWLGGGPGTLGARLQVSFSRFVPETGRTLSTVVTNAHNEYLGYLVNAGVPALGLYLGMMGLTLAARRPGREGVLWAVAAYWAQGFFALGLCLSAPLLWAAWGLYMSPPEGSE